MTQYGLILIDQYDTPYNSALVIKDKVLFDWITEPVDFKGGTGVTVPLPAGYKTEDGETSAHVTIGSWDNDKAHFVASIIENHPEAGFDLEFETDAEDDEEGGDGGDLWTKDAKEAFAKLEITDIYEGLWY